MTTQVQTQIRSLAIRDGISGRVTIPSSAKTEVTKALVGFIDTLAAASGQSTYYNSKEEQTAAMDAVHTAIYKVNRGLYAAMLAMPGVRDVSVQKGMSTLLQDHTNVADSLLEPNLETLLLTRMANHLPPQRMLKLFGLIREKKINNRRTRRLILATVLGSENLELWAVKYRAKMKTALTHAWGRGTAWAVTTALETAPSRRNSMQIKVLQKNLLPYISTSAVLEDVRECVLFIFNDGQPGDHRKFTVPLLRKFVLAKTDFSAGAGLPKEVLEGIRGRYHPTIPKGATIEASKETMTEKQKVRAQAEAKSAGVELDFNPEALPLLDLYVYVLQQGWGAKKAAIKAALKRKAEGVAKGLSIRYDRVGVLVDSSVSMFGTEMAKRRPLAIALAMRDVLVAAATKKSYVVASGAKLDEDGLIQPCGSTSLAHGLVELLQDGVDAIYIITDGYENAPAGRVNEVMKQVRRMGITTPVYQVTPVIGAEVASVRSLSDEIGLLPVGNPENLGLASIRASLETDPASAIEALIGEGRRLAGESNVRKLN